MRYLRTALLAATLAAAGLTAGGCCEQEKQMAAEIEGKNAELRTENDGLQIRLADATSQVGRLRDETDQKQATINDLRTQLAGRPAPAPDDGTAKGWEKGVHGDRITVEGDILFSSGKATLTAKGKAALGAVVRDLKTTYANLPVRVYGHTDSDKIVKTKHLWTDNLDLSANRAMAVARHLVDMGIGAKRIETIAMGEHYPAATKDKSRRVEIVVIKD